MAFRAVSFMTQVSMGKIRESGADATLFGVRIHLPLVIQSHNDLLIKVIIRQAFKIT